MGIKFREFLKALIDADEDGIRDDTEVVIDENRKVQNLVYDNLTDILYIW